MSKNIILIPARSGSKGVMNKNIRMFRGAPLIFWSIIAARYVAEVLEESEIIFTSDSARYIALVNRFAEKHAIKIKCHKRSEDASNDVASMAEVIHEVVRDCADKDKYADRLLVLLQPTSPIRSKNDILKVVQLLKIGTDSIAIAVKTNYAVDDLYVFTPDAGGAINLANRMGFEVATRRQDQKVEVLYLDGSFYGIKLDKGSCVRTIEKMLKFPNQIYKSILDKNVDIDSEADLRNGGTLYKNFRKLYGDDIVSI